jgi:hypothetical protein
MKITLEFRCTCRGGKCVFEGADHNRCITMTADEEAYVCSYLEAERVGS